MGNSAAFDGTGDYLSLADSEDWNFGSGDFTIDFWIRQPTTNNFNYVFYTLQGTTASLQIAINDSQKIYVGATTEGGVVMGI